MGQDANLYWEAFSQQAKWEKHRPERVRSICWWWGWARRSCCRGPTPSCSWNPPSMMIMVKMFASVENIIASGDFEGITYIYFSKLIVFLFVSTQPTCWAMCSSRSTQNPSKRWFPVGAGSSAATWVWLIVVHIGQPVIRATIWNFQITLKLNIPKQKDQSR